MSALDAETTAHAERTCETCVRASKAVASLCPRESCVEHGKCTALVECMLRPPLDEVVGAPVHVWRTCRVQRQVGVQR